MKIKQNLKILLFKNKHFKDQENFREILKESYKKNFIHLSSFLNSMFKKTSLQIQDTQGKFITVIKGKFLISL